MNILVTYDVLTPKMTSPSKALMALYDELGWSCMQEPNTWVSTVTKTFHNRENVTPGRVTLVRRIKLVPMRHKVGIKCIGCEVY